MNLQTPRLAAKQLSTPKGGTRRRSNNQTSPQPKPMAEVLAAIGPRDATNSPTPKNGARRGSTTRPTNLEAMPKGESSGGSNSRQANNITTPRKRSSAGTKSQRARVRTAPKVDAPVGLHSGDANVVPAPKARARRRPARPSNEPATPKVVPSGGSTTPRQTTGTATSNKGPSVGAKPAGRQRRHGAQTSTAAGTGMGPVAMDAAAPKVDSLLDPILAFTAAVLDGIEDVRIANENRLRQLTRSVDDVDGEERGFGLTEDHPAVARLAAIVATLVQVEKDATKALEKTLQDHPLHPWVKEQHGIGDKQGARLIASIGDPYIRPELHYSDGTVKPEGPRTVSALWAYSGYHTVPYPVDHAPSGTQRRPADQALPDTQRNCVGGNTVADQMKVVWLAAKRARGQKANWSATAKMRAHLIAEKVVQLGFRPKDADETWRAPYYRQVYDNRRAVTADRVHALACVRCGPSGKPAPAGSPWSKGHQHADGLRIVAKEILKDLWREGRRLHEPADGDQHADDTQRDIVTANPNVLIDQNATEDQSRFVDGDRAALDQVVGDTQDAAVGDSPMNNPADHATSNAHRRRVSADRAVSGQNPSGTQSAAARGGP